MWNVAFVTQNKQLQSTNKNNSHTKKGLHIVLLFLHLILFFKHKTLFFQTLIFFSCWIILCSLHTICSRSDFVLQQQLKWEKNAFQMDIFSHLKFCHNRKNDQIDWMTIETNIHILWNVVYYHCDDNPFFAESEFACEFASGLRPHR